MASSCKAWRSFPCFFFFKDRSRQTEKTLSRCKCSEEVCTLTQQHSGAAATILRAEDSSKTCPSGWKHQQHCIWHPGAIEPSSCALDHTASCWSCHRLCGLIDQWTNYEYQGCYLLLKKSKQVCAFLRSPRANCPVRCWKWRTWDLTRTKCRASQCHTGP